MSLKDRKNALKELRDAVIAAIESGAEAWQIEDEVSEAFLIKEKSVYVDIHDE